MRQQLVLMGLLCGAVVVGARLVSWRTERQVMSVSEAAFRLSRAQMFAQDADMLHDAIHADVLTALLASGSGDPVRLKQAQSELDGHVIGLRDALASSSAEWQQALAAPLSTPDVEPYLLGAGRIVARLRDQPQLASRDLAEFERQFEQLRDELGRLTLEQMQPALATARAQVTSLYAAAEKRELLLGAGTIAAWVAMLLAFSRGLLGALRRLGDTARAMAAGDLDVRHTVSGDDEFADLGTAFNGLAEALQQNARRLEREAAQAAFGSQLGEAMELADSQADVHAVVRRALPIISAEMPMELLLADSSHSHLERAAEHPVTGAPGCNVGSPAGCMAVRRGQRLVFDSSGALNACPHLQGRPAACAAVCVPVTFMGKAIGVIHATAAEYAEQPTPLLSMIDVLATQVGTRLGTLRVLEKTQLQATTDSLTGLLNRRAFEERFRHIRESGAEFALALADLDHFKRLNDTFGHDAGDRALRKFADILRTHTPKGALVARFGGEEFVVVYPGLSAQTALAETHQLREATRSSGDFPVTCSFGIVDFSEAASLEELLQIADVALYQSKQAGRDRSTIGTASGRNVQRAAEPQYASTAS